MTAAIVEDDPHDPGAEIALRAAAGAGTAHVRVAIPAAEQVLVELRGDPEPFRLEAGWRAADERAPDRPWRPARPAVRPARAAHPARGRPPLHGSRLPAGHAGRGRDPPGRLRPSAVAAVECRLGALGRNRGPGLDLDLAGPELSLSQRAAAGPLRLHFFCDPTPAARLRRYLRLTGTAPVLPEWAYGHWKSRDVYAHQRDVEEDWRGYRENDLPLDAIVIDSPWETQYNTWRFNPHQFPDPRGLIQGMRADGVRTVVWVTPWTNLDSSDGQRPPDRESERMHARPADNYSEGALAGHFVRGRDGKAWVGRWWMGTGSIVDFTSPAARRWWQRQARSVLAMGVQGIKADDGEGYYVPPDARFADGRTGAEAAWAFGDLYRRTMQEVLDEVHGGDGVLFGHSS